MADNEEPPQDPDQTLPSTQTPSQPSQSDQPDLEELRSTSWGCLSPLHHWTPTISSSGAERESFYFRLEDHVQKVGRSRDNCSIALTENANDISRLHAKITWDGVRGRKSVCKVIHLSESSKTYLGTESLKHNQVYILSHGDHLSFGGSNHTRSFHRFSFTFLAKDDEHAPFEDRYELSVDSKLGEGGFAEVFKGIKRDTGDYVAIKMIKKGDHPIREEDVENPNTHIKRLIELTRKEVAAMRRVQHLNITKLLDEYWEESVLQTKYLGYLVLEFIDGTTLLRYMHEHKVQPWGLPEDQTKALMWQILNGTVYLHSRRIIHRDLKPENVMLTSHKQPIIKLSDFGLARVLSSSNSLAHTPCGSPDYVAPEILRERGQSPKAPAYNAKVDAFSIGAMFYVMLFSSLPYTTSQGKHGANLVDSVRKRKIRLAPFGQAEISNEARTLFQALINTEPSARLAVNDALSHLWFQGYVPPKHHIQTSEDDSESVFHSQVSSLSLEDDGTQYYSQEASSSQGFPSSQVSAPLQMPGAYNFSQDSASLYGTPRSKENSQEQENEDPEAQSASAGPSSPAPSSKEKGKSPLKRTISVVNQNTTQFLYGSTSAEDVSAEPPPALAPAPVPAPPPSRPVKKVKTSHRSEIV